MFDTVPEISVALGSGFTLTGTWNFSYELELVTPVAHAACVLLRYNWSRELQFLALVRC